MLPLQISILVLQQMTESVGLLQRMGFTLQPLRGSSSEDIKVTVPRLTEGRNPVVDWGYNKGGKCLNNITISANGRGVNAMVVDECDSTSGCDDDHDYQPPCANNIVDASKAVWEALGVPSDDWGELNITWSDA
ncbi:hypothetical protein F0562_014878 [Nyssa sinensis]|uniref:Uncharacterized protein n=1 Tax=Nyssa sinensis TaxID=561372 RepID=A0A5J4ZTA4_9ASTE|nr:hypothetical protein F0562_014878 [Nyssa sinensis]